MFCKKIEARREGVGENVLIDFSWLLYIGMNKLGFSYRECGWLYFGQWCDLFEIYKKQYNFEKKNMLYALQPEVKEEPISSLSVL